MSMGRAGTPWRSLGPASRAVAYSASRTPAAGPAIDGLAIAIAGRTSTDLGVDSAAARDGWTLVSGGSRDFCEGSAGLGRTCAGPPDSPSPAATSSWPDCPAGREGSIGCKALRGPDGGRDRRAAVASGGAGPRRPQAKQAPPRTPPLPCPLAPPATPS